MNPLKNIIAFIIILVFAVSCEKEFDNLSKLNGVTAPAKVTAIFDITQDNSGLVTIIPNAEGVTEFMITFGDTTNESPTIYGLNEVITHTYTEGVYNVGITGSGLTGLTTTYQAELNVT
nr:PKD domain protein [Bacteroidota bacterium]